MSTLISFAVITEYKAQVYSVFHEVFAVHAIGLSLTTYRIFAAPQYLDDFLSSVYAAGSDALELGSSDAFIHNDGAGAMTGDA